MVKLQAFLNGKKTFLMAFAGAATLVSVYFGWLEADLGNQLLALFGFAGLAALRAAK